MLSIILPIVHVRVLYVQSALLYVRDCGNYQIVWSHYEKLPILDVVAMGTGVLGRRFQFVYRAAQK